MKAGLEADGFLLFGNFFVKETRPKTQQNMEHYMAILGTWIMLMITSLESAPSHEQVTFIRLKRAIYKVRQLRQFVESHVGFSYFPLIALFKNTYYI